MKAAQLHNVYAVIGGGNSPVARTSTPTDASAAQQAPKIQAAANQGFVPTSATPANGAANGAPAGGGIPADQALQAMQQLLGEVYGEPIIAADGRVYLPSRKPSLKNGQLSIDYVLAGKVDRNTKTMQLSPRIMEELQAAQKDQSGEARKLVKVDDQYVWQTFSKDENGNPVVTSIEPASEAELQQMQAKAEQREAADAAKAKLENRQDWQRKLGTVAQNLGLFGSIGQLVNGLGSGPNDLTGRPGATWLQGYILATRLNGKAEGKLLPRWMQEGPVATAIDVGLQVYGMLDMGSDIRTIRDFLKKTPSTFADSINQNAVQELIGRGVAAPQAEAMVQAGIALRSGQYQIDPRYAAMLNGRTGVHELALKSDLQAGFNATDAQSMGNAVRSKIDNGAVKGISALKGLVQPAVIGASALGFISSAMTVKTIVEKNGAKVLLDTQQGRGALMSALTSASFLGLYTLPKILPALGVGGAAIGATMSAVNLASNVLGGVQMLDRYGLFGEKGILNHDALRAAFLIPPLTPIGAFAFFMKKSKEKQEEQAAKLEAAQKSAAQHIAQQAKVLAAQLQTGQAVSSGTANPDGSFTLAAPFPETADELKK